MMMTPPWCPVHVKGQRCRRFHGKPRMVSWSLLSLAARAETHAISWVFELRVGKSAAQLGMKHGDTTSTSKRVAKRSAEARPVTQQTPSTSIVRVRTPSRILFSQKSAACAHVQSRDYSCAGDTLHHCLNSLPMPCQRSLMITATRTYATICRQSNLRILKYAGMHCVIDPLATVVPNELKCHS